MQSISPYCQGLRNYLYRGTSTPLFPKTYGLELPYTGLQLNEGLHLVVCAVIHARTTFPKPPGNNESDRTIHANKVEVKNNEDKGNDAKVPIIWSQCALLFYLNYLVIKQKPDKETCRDYYVATKSKLKTFERYKAALKNLKFYGLAFPKKNRAKKTDLTVEYLREILMKQSIEQLQETLREKSDEEKK